MSTTPDPITQIEPIVLRIPFDDGGKGHGIMPTRWNALDIMMLRAETASGLVGWGEGFGYLCQHVTARAVKDMITPFAMGRDSRDPAQVNRDAQLALHLFGRFGITMFAISALDIALWDIAAKRENLSLGRLLGGRSGMAGELGHITVNPSGVRCGCGNHGCLETLATDHSHKCSMTTEP